MNPFYRRDIYINSKDQEGITRRLSSYYGCEIKLDIKNNTYLNNPAIKEKLKKFKHGISHERQRFSQIGNSKLKYYTCIKGVKYADGICHKLYNENNLR